MNYVNNLKIVNTITNETYDLKECNIRFVDNLSLGFTPEYESYTLNDSTYFEDNDFLVDGKIEIESKIDVANDYAFKRFINRNKNSLKLVFEINSITYEIFAKSADQFSEINSHYYKTYTITFLMKTKPMRVTTYVDGGTGILVFNPYGVIKYGEVGYGLSTEIPSIILNTGDSNLYFTIEGTINRTDKITITVDDNTLTLTSKSANLGKQLLYSNMPANTWVKINGAFDYSMLSPTTNNFLFDLKKPDFMFSVNGLDNVILTIYEVVDII